MPRDLLPNQDVYQPVIYYYWPEGMYDNSLFVKEVEGVARATEESSALALAEEIPKLRTYHGSYFTELYGALEEDISGAQLDNVQFLGYTFRAHPFVVDPLRRVEGRIKQNVCTQHGGLEEVLNFLAGVNKMSAYA